MSRRNFKVATTEEGKTTLVKIDKAPQGTVKTTKSKEELRKAQEEAYENFRIGALKRRAKRMKLSEEETKAKIEELKKQLSEPNQYSILVMFNENDKKLFTEAIANAGLKCKIIGATYAYVEGDQAIVDKIREFEISTMKVFPYVKKKPQVLPIEQPPKIRAVKKRTKPKKKSLAVTSDERKEKKIRTHRNKKTGQIEHRKMSARPNRNTKNVQKKAILKPSKRVQSQKATTVQMSTKKRSTASKKASTSLKQAA